MFTRACPILPSADAARTKSFYARLGFAVVGDYPAEGYLILRRDAVELHFFAAPGHVAPTCDHGVFVRVEDARALSAEYGALGELSEGIPRVVPAQDKPWGVRELSVVDPDGNLIRLGHPLVA